MIEAFANVPTVYLADGHHRIESPARLAADQEQKGLPVYNSLSALYMASDQLRIMEYDRVVVPLQPVDKIWLFERLALNFDIKPFKQPVQPREAHCIGLYFNKKWYNLYAKPHTYI